MRDLAVLVPTRGRPGNIEKVIAAWDFTNAWDVADLVLVIDEDDPEYQRYVAIVDRFALSEVDEAQSPLKAYSVPRHVPMVHKLNQAAQNVALNHWAVGFAGDDHVPQTIGWAKRYLTVLAELGTGMVYGDDGYQGAKLSTEWAVTADAVRALGRMVPADVEHMYCDNSMLDLFTGAGAVRHLPEVRIEHMHPVVGKAETDEQYQRVNHRDQFRKDRAAYELWRERELPLSIETVKALRPGRPEERPVADLRRIREGSGPRPVTGRRRGGPVERSGPSYLRPKTSFGFPRHFRLVRGATPDEIGMTLADFASAVPADQEIVELGVFQGRTALLMAWGASKGHGAHVTGIDPWDSEGNVYDPPFTDAASREAAWHNVGSQGYGDRVSLIQDFSHRVAEEWEPEDKRVGLLYVDGDHTKDGAKRDIVSWAPHLAPGARIAVDDYGHPDWPGVGQAVDELIDEGFLAAPIELYHDRLAVTRLNRPVVTSITSEGVGTSPTVPGQVAVPGPVNTSSGPPEGWVQRTDGSWYDPAVLEAEWERVDPDGVAALRRSAAEIDSKLSTWDVVAEGELEGVPAGTDVTELNLARLKALAKARNITLGARKDLRVSILAALREGR